MSVEQTAPRVDTAVGSARMAPESVRFPRLPSLTGLRFLAAFVVFGFHATISPLFGVAGDANIHARSVGGIGFLFGQGATGVSFFFILSGFVLTWSARPTDRFFRFWRRRAAKIYPNHLITASAALAALVTVGATPTIAAVIGNVLLVQAWVPTESVFFGLNTPSWSLSCEAAFYLCFPVLLVLIRRMQGRWLWPVTIAVLVAIAAVPAVAMALPDRFEYWFVYVFPPVRMLEFVVGILLARIVQVDRWIGLGVVPAAALAVAGYAVSGFLPGAFAYVAGTAAPFALLIPAVAAVDLRGGPSVLRSRVLVWLGEISFAFYLQHQLVIRLFEKVFAHRDRPALVEICLILAILAVSVLVSWALYRIVERPMMTVLAGRRAPAGRHREGRAIDAEVASRPSAEGRHVAMSPRRFLSARRPPRTG